MPELSFIKQETLNLDLKKTLTELGYAKKELEIIDKTSKVNVTENKEPERNYLDYYTPKLLEDVLRRDALIFKIFPEYLPSSFKEC